MSEHEFHRQVDLLISDFDSGDITHEEFEEAYEDLLEELNASQTA
jgi:hypothetical protein